jgi:predicted O-methyltransferase YrrM
MTGSRKGINGESKRRDWRMGGITVPEVEEYLYAMLPPRDEVLAEMEDDAGKNDVPIVGPAVARVLYQLAVISGAKKVFEMGSAIGYSTIWWARAVGEGGTRRLHRRRPKRAGKSSPLLRACGRQPADHVRVGDALEILSEEKEAVRHHLQRCR